MAHVESQQVTLRLTNDKTVLGALRKRRALRRDEKGEKFVIQFDGNSFEFRQGVDITVGRTIGESLYRSSVVIVGDDLTGDMKAALVKSAPSALGSVSEQSSRRHTICPVCQKEQYTLKQLSRHLAKAHVEDRPDLYEPPVKGATDWNMKFEDQKPSGTGVSASAPEQVDFDEALDEPLEEGMIAEEGEAGEESE